MGSSGSKNRNQPYSNDTLPPWNSPENFSYYNPESPLRMPIQPTFKCNQCGMIFPTDEALFKHRTRFCIGLKDARNGRQVYYSDDEETNGYTNRPRFRKIEQIESPTDKKRNEINEWKNQRSILQSVQDMEDRILHDSQKTQKLANDLKKRTHDYNQILTEYEQLQTQERDLLRQMFNLQGQSGSNVNHPNGLTDHETNQLESLQRQNARLEHERQIIQNKLEDLIASNREPSIMHNYEPYKLLRDMKEQQDQNERTLSFLRKRLIYPENLLSTSYDNLSLPYVSSNRRRGSDNIRILRYGYDADILARYSDLQHRLRQYEYYPWMRDYPEPLRHYQFRPMPSVDTAIANDKLLTAKQDNQRLQMELNNMQRKFQKLDSRTRQLELTLATSGVFESKSNGSHSYPSSNIDHYPPINSSTYTSSRQPYNNYDTEPFDQNRYYQQTSLPALNRRITSHPTGQFNSTTMNRMRNAFEPQAYDPINGFVMFFDFIINFPPIIDRCRLITCLHHSQTGLGEPSQLQPFKSELHTDDTNGERIGIALISTKQPVPRCPPQQALSIVIEVQTTTKQAPNEPLRTNAWTKIPLFDHRNRLINGRWKIPLRRLPIHQDESFSVISTLPTFGRAELYYRLVNFSDAAEQSNAVLSPNFRDLYFSPPQLRNRP